MQVIEYEQSMGEINLTETMRATLAGLPIEEQAKHFVVLQADHTEKFSYGESVGDRYGRMTKAPENCYYALEWIAHNGILVGIVFRTPFFERRKAAFLGQWVETYFAIDEDGTGSDDCSVYCALAWKE